MTIINNQTEDKYRNEHEPSEEFIKSHQHNCKNCADTVCCNRGKDRITYCCCYAELREKCIEALETQIEKMKCCENCKHFDFDEPKYCHKGVYNCAYVCDKWELGD